MKLILVVIKPMVFGSLQMMQKTSINGNNILLQIIYVVMATPLSTPLRLR
jgi:hypothetical protein